jgi:glycine/D-amino acid oxidase-like deaminating enzyme
MKTLSYWEKYFYTNYDLVIIGSGIVGLSSAIYVQKAHPNWKILVAERSTTPYGASTRNAGFACFGSISEMASDIEHHSEQELVELIRNRVEGLELLKNNVPPSKMDFLPLGGYEIFLKEEASKFTNYSKALDYYNDICYRATGREDTFVEINLPFAFDAYHKCFYNQYEGQLNPAKMIHNLSKKAVSMGVQIVYGKELVEYLEKDRNVHLHFTDESHLIADRLLLATNAFTNSLIENLDITPQRNQVLVTEEIPSLRLKGTFHYNEGFVYFRNVDNRILLGGFRDKESAQEQTEEFGLTDDIQQHLENFLYNVLQVDKEVKVEHRWSGILATGQKKEPINQRLSDSVYCAVRLGGMGVAIGTKAGKDISELIV